MNWSIVVLGFVMKTILILVIGTMMNGCSTVKQARTDFQNFKSNIYYNVVINS